MVCFVGPINGGVIDVLTQNSFVLVVSHTSRCYGYHKSAYSGKRIGQDVHDRVSTTKIDSTMFVYV